MAKKLITAKEITEKFKITFQTINHYTNFGLLDVVTKHGNVRLYDEVEVEKRLAKIQQLIAEGYPLRLIRKQLVGI
ncbi:MAG: MerR family transcriptional regulator [Candidatus Omnitrophota bacterium]